VITHCLIGNEKLAIEMRGERTRWKNQHQMR
jgi:hypothetical protein